MARRIEHVLVSFSCSVTVSSVRWYNTCPPLSSSCCCTLYRYSSGCKRLSCHVLCMYSGFANSGQPLVTGSMVSSAVLHLGLTSWFKILCWQELVAKLWSWATTSGPSVFALSPVLFRICILLLKLLLVGYFPCNEFSSKFGGTILIGLLAQFSQYRDRFIIML